jgi:hypothetical protein
LLVILLIIWARLSFCVWPFDIHFPCYYMTCSGTLVDSQIVKTMSHCHQWEYHLHDMCGIPFPPTNHFQNVNLTLLTWFIKFTLWFNLKSQSVRLFSSSRTSYSNALGLPQICLRSIWTWCSIYWWMLRLWTLSREGYFRRGKHSVESVILRTAALGVAKIPHKKTEILKIIGDL